MAERRPYDLFEQWPDDDADIVQAEGTTWGAMAVVIAVVVLVVTVAAVVGFVALARWLEDRNTAEDVLGLLTEARRFLR